MNKEIFDKVKRFTVNQSAVEEKLVTEDACLEADLGIYGDDAVEYILAFGKEFNVDVSKFMAADYFSPDGGFKLPPIISKLFRGKKPNEKKLTIGHLMKAVERGRLDEDVINSKK